ncbi:hypothetical protein ACOIPX_004720 [Salmonella enterica]
MKKLNKRRSKKAEAQKVCAKRQMRTLEKSMKLINDTMGAYAPYL